VTISEQELISLVVGWVKTNHRGKGNGAVEIREDTDLIASGLLDSFALIDLILYLETRTFCEIDLTDVDPREFCVVKDLCKIALKNHKNHQADGEFNAQPNRGNVLAASPEV